MRRLWREETGMSSTETGGASDRPADAPGRPYAREARGATSTLEKLP